MSFSSLDVATWSDSSKLEMFRNYKYQVKYATTKRITNVDFHAYQNNESKIQDQTNDKIKYQIKDQIKAQIEYLIKDKILSCIENAK